MRRLAWGVLCFAGLMPALAPALELGPIEARSATREPVDARIPVRDAGAGDLGGLSIELGSPAQFELAGVERRPHLGLLQFVVVQESESEGYIQVRTDEPIGERSLTFLIDVDWPRGRMVRGYKLHLGPPAGASAGERRVRRVLPVTAAESGAESATEPEDSPVPPVSPPVPERAPSPTPPPEPGGTEYGPVRDAETLWGIASRTRPDRSVSTQRMMLALLKANPRAFAIDNVNTLKAGVTLRVPNRDEIESIDARTANAELERQQAEWQQYRKRPSTRSEPAPVPVRPDPEAEPGGRIEVVSPDTPTEAREPESGDVTALRRELALAMEAADAGRRENDELRMRLTEVESHLGELNRLVQLKNEEIATLQARIGALSETAPATDTRPAVGEEEPPATPAQDKPVPAAAPDGNEPVSLTGSGETAPKVQPFGLGALPVNPVFLVGGAGLLLLLLGVLALLRRRRASAGEEAGGLQAAEASPSGEGDALLHELEAVAADLSDEPDELPDRRPRSAPAAASDADAGSGSSPGDAAESESERLVEERFAELWRDGNERVPEFDFPGELDAEQDTDETSFDIDALIDGDSDRSPKKDDAAAAGASTGGPAAATDEGGEGAAAGEPVDSAPEPSSSDEPDTPTLEEFSDDEVQTKLDLAQVYMEMGDADSARGFLEAVLTEGDPGQQAIARDMLSKLA